MLQNTAFVSVQSRLFSVCILKRISPDPSERPFFSLKNCNKKPTGTNIKTLVIIKSICFFHHNKNACQKKYLKNLKWTRKQREKNKKGKLISFSFNKKKKGKWILRLQKPVLFVSQQNLFSANKNENT